jgi:NAD(P)-dependent dehydrogenase (short-subunit alcohol dehydrogenase family)
MVDADRPQLAGNRNEHCVLSPLEISSRSKRLSASLARRRAGGRILLARSPKRPKTIPGQIGVRWNSSARQPVGSRGSVVDEKVEEYRRVMQVNVETMFLLSKHAIPAMIKTAKGGAIVNISSISALRPRGLTTYTTSKAAVIGLTQAMAVDHRRDNIRVNCICPGPMYTPMVYARGNGMSEAARAQRANASVLKTEGTSWDVGHAVKFLLSDYARYITGQVLVVDGGVTLQGPERDSRDH